MRRMVGDMPPVLLLGAGASADAGIGATPELFKFFSCADFVAKIMRHLGSKHPLVEPLAQLLHDPSRSTQVLRLLVIFQQLFYDRWIYPWLLRFFGSFAFFFCFGHFHLLSQVATHTQFFRPAHDGFISQQPCEVSAVSRPQRFADHLLSLFNTD
jgi:hypothetical protein